MDRSNLPEVFAWLMAKGCVRVSDLLHTQDGFWMVYQSMSDLLTEKGIESLACADGEVLACPRFFDDWFLYAILSEGRATYSLVKLREQEQDAKEDAPADGDTPGVTVSFVAFDTEALIDCISNPSEENRIRLYQEINRVVVKRGVRHDAELKRYFIRKDAEASCFIAQLYARHIVLLSEGMNIEVPESYQAMAKNPKARLVRFVASLNQKAGYTVCDGKQIFIRDREALTEYERAAIYATHTGNTSEQSFANEVRFHAKFLTSLARIKIPFFGRSLYDSAIRADMTVDDQEFALFARWMQGRF